MKSYTVQWTIEVVAEDHKTAARKAKRIQREPRNGAGVFVVWDTARWKDRQTVDLDYKPEQLSINLDIRA